MSAKVEQVTLEPTRIEVGTGEPGYRWVDGVYIVRATGKLYPPMRVREAKAICKREGWTIGKTAK